METAAAVELTPIAPFSMCDVTCTDAASASRDARLAGSTEALQGTKAEGQQYK